jgi:hypothetical protein
MLNTDNIWGAELLVKRPKPLEAIMSRINRISLTEAGDNANHRATRAQRLSVTD